MKTIVWKDNAHKDCPFHEWVQPDVNKNLRIYEALNDIEHLANITVYMLKGNRLHKLFRRGYNKYPSLP
jgi:hypothetical protein